MVTISGDEIVVILDENSCAEDTFVKKPLGGTVVEDKEQFKNECYVNNA